MRVRDPGVLACLGLEMPLQSSSHSPSLKIQAPAGRPCDSRPSLWSHDYEAESEDPGGRSVRPEVSIRQGLKRSACENDDIIRVSSMKKDMSHGFLGVPRSGMSLVGL